MKGSSSNYILYALAMYSLLAIGTSCKKENMGDCFRSTGNITTESREVNLFSHVDLSDNINLILTDGPSKEVIVEAGENLLEKIVTEVKDQTLYLKNTSRCNWVRSFKTPVNVYVSANNLRGVDFRGSGNITSNDTLKGAIIGFDFWDAGGSVDITIDTDTFFCSIHTGPGNAIVQGKTKYCYQYSIAHGVIDCSGLEASSGFVKNGGSGDCRINADEELTISIWGVGNVYYTGDPVINFKLQTGEGELIRE